QQGRQEHSAGCDARRSELLSPRRFRRSAANRNRDRAQHHTQRAADAAQSKPARIGANMTTQTLNAPQGAAAIGWSSRAMFILAAAGSAVGLGNIWKFPYIVGEH